MASRSCTRILLTGLPVGSLVETPLYHWSKKEGDCESPQQATRYSQPSGSDELKRWPTDP